MAGLKNVIIVEDEPMIRDLYRSALIKAQFTVQVAVSAEDLYQKLLVFHPDYIFLDIMLPNVSGLEILKELRTNVARGCQHAKIVMLTNLAQRSVMDKVTDMGADGYLIKADILPKDLARVIASLEEDGET